MENKPISSLGALVFASSYTALGIVRSLGRHGIPVWVIGEWNSPFGGIPLREAYPAIGGQDEPEQVAFLRGWAARTISKLGHLPPIATKASPAGTQSAGAWRNI